MPPSTFQDTLIITATRRLALRQQQTLSAASKNPALALPIFSLNDWFGSLWDMFQISISHSPFICLSAIKEQALWLAQVEKSDHGLHLLKPKQTAKQLMQTWKLLNEWCLAPEELDWGQQEERLICKQWMLSFMDELTHRLAITSAQIPAFLFEKALTLENFVENHIPFKKIVMNGFDDFTPQVRRWIEWFKDYGINVEIANQQAIKVKAQRYTFSSQDQELHYVAQHALEWTQSNPNKVIGIVVPDIVENRQKIAHYFDQVCDKKACASPDFQVSWQYNISAGMALNDYPIIQSVFLSFELLKPTFNTQMIIALMQSPFFKGGASELKQRLEIIYQLQANLKSRVSLSSLLAMDLQAVPIWKNILEQIDSIRAGSQKTMSAHHWLLWINQWLSIFDWPGERRLNSPEHQVMASFNLALKEWAKLGSLDLSWPDALSWLKTICQDISFQPESNPTNIQIMGLLEASGQKFDQLWVLGLNSEIWPAKPAPDPFIPLSIQLLHQMPHSTPQRELLFAKHLTENLKASAPEVYFSYALQRSGQTFQVSPLIEELLETKIKDVQCSRVEQALLSSALFITASEYEPQPWQVHEAIKGGATLIQDQSQCPFKAFAKHRLHVNDFTPEGPGVSVFERGKLLHHCLEMVWGSLKDWHTLVATSEQDLSLLVDDVLVQLPMKLPLRGLYGQIEKRRLKLLILSWLALEKRRKPFTVSHTEVKVQVAFDKFILNCRIDRVDIGEDGSTIIIDYKSSNVALKDCFGDRPNAPQLPLYCFADLPKQPNAIVFAQMTRDTCYFVGVSESAGLLPNVNTMAECDFEGFPSQWQDGLTHWKQILNKLAMEYLDGHHQVKPTSTKTCDFCHLHRFCRVMEKQDD